MFTIQTLYKIIFEVISPFIDKQERQCMYNVTLRRVRKSLSPWKSGKYYVFVVVRACVEPCLSSMQRDTPYYDVMYGPCGCAIFFDIIA